NESSNLMDLAHRHLNLIKLLTKMESISLQLSNQFTKPKNVSVGVVNEQCTVYLIVENMNVDFEIKKLQNKYQGLEKAYQKLYNQVSMEGYALKVPKNIQEKNAVKLQEWKQEMEKIESNIKELETYK